ncbi:hypothetical protein Acr_16g0009210 [Actinidia rufa]|uniref:Uncharacterized protein n=1 Tax=Actinidia rufa TaxID=165716 RepID=A0A7J0G0M5_9ERIC|nr:hypothetical protein Acr_16g0009210 [Actinidia rufa]
MLFSTHTWTRSSTPRSKRSARTAPLDQPPLSSRLARPPPMRRLDESERLELKIVAAEHLCNSFVEIYDIKASDAGISQPLERLAIARFAST